MNEVAIGILQAGGVLILLAFLARGGFELFVRAMYHLKWKDE